MDILQVVQPNYMKKLWLPVLLALYAVPLFAQDNNIGTLILMDEQMNETRLMDSAKYFLNIRKLNDTTWRHDYYQLTGPRWRSETFIDEDGSKAHGRFAFYNKKGFLDSVGDAFNGRRHGTWYFYEPGKVAPKMIGYKEYDHGRLVKEKDLRIKEEDTDDDKDVFKEAIFKGNFKKFLEENLQFPKRAISLDLGDVVTVDFVVDAQGNVTDPLVVRSIEVSLDRESERMILLSSGRWKPATLNKESVKSYHQQPFNYALIEED